MAEELKMSMVVKDAEELYDRLKEMKEFDDMKIGVKGLVDSGVVKIPRFFIHSPENLRKQSTFTGDSDSNIQIPIIDLAGVNSDRRNVIVDEIRRAAETWGFFQMVNHGIPINILDEMIEGVRRFHEQPKEVKMEIYSNDFKQNTVLNSCGGRLHKHEAAVWKDTLQCNFKDDDHQLDSNEYPDVCRKIMIEYVKYIVGLNETLSELLSEALGLSPDYLGRSECMKTQSLSCHYAPPCPEPDLTFGSGRHSDPCFLTILLQDDCGGLQVLHQDQWFDVAPTKGALIANIGDLLQLITNDKFKSVEHRVLSQRIGPRISVATFFYPSAHGPKPYGPIKELLSDGNPPTYRETTAAEYVAFYMSKVVLGDPVLPYFKL